MSRRPDIGAITVRATGTTVTTAGTSANVALSTIPTKAGTAPRYVALMADTICYVKPGDSSGVTATTNDLMVNGSAAGVVLSVTGCTHIAYIQGTAGAKLNIVPLEDM